MNSPAPRRTWFTSLAGAAAVLCGGIGSLFSAFALLMAIGKPYANSASDPLGIFLIFILPPSMLFAGIGLLLRRRWARGWMILLMAALVGLGVKGLIAPGHGDPADAGRPFVPMLSIAAVAAGGLALLGLLSGPVRREFQAVGRNPSPGLPPSPSVPVPSQGEGEGWRVGHLGRDRMFYEELRDGTWERIEIDGEMLTGRAHHVIYFAGPDAWRAYPEWARERRDEIIARVKSRFREPDYEHHGGGAGPRKILRQPSRRDGGILPMLAFLIAIAGACFWFAAKGVKDGETRLPVKHGAGRMVSREEKPVMFWTSVSVLSGLGVGCAAFAAWLVIDRLRRR